MGTIDANEETRRQVAEIRAQFAEEAGGATVSVLRRDGVYRHARYELPRASWRECELVTWPHVLVLRGEWGVWAFSGTEDMFDRFPGPAVAEDGVDPADAAAMLDANVAEAVVGYGEERVSAYVREAVAGAAARYEGLAEDAEAFFFGGRDGVDLGTEKGLREAVGRFEERYAEQYRGFRFAVDGWDLRRYDPRFLLACAVLPWAVAEYDAGAAVPPVV